jgi:hypothetical protein
VDVALVILPGHPELDDPLRLYQAVHDALFDILRLRLHHRDQGGQNLLDRLVKFRLCRIPPDHALHQAA